MARFSCQLFKFETHFYIRLLCNPLIYIKNISIGVGHQKGMWRTSAHKFYSEPCLWLTWGRGNKIMPIRTPSGENSIIESTNAFSSPMLTPESELLPMPFPHSFGPSDHLIQMQIKVGSTSLLELVKLLHVDRHL